MCCDDYGFGCPDWNGDGKINVFDMVEEDLFCESVTDKSNGYSSGSFGGSGFFHSAGRKRSETNYTFSEGFSDLIDLISPHHEEHITSLWEDKWKLAELILYMIYTVALVPVCYLEFREYDRIVEPSEILFYMFVVSIFASMLILGFRVWKSVSKSLDPSRDYFDYLAEVPDEICPEPADRQTPILFFVSSAVVLWMGFNPDNVKRSLMLTNGVTNIATSVLILAPIFFVLIYKLIKVVKQITIKKELMEGIEKKTPLVIKPLKVLLTIVIITGLVLSAVAVAHSKKEADGTAEYLYLEVKRCIAAENYGKAEEKLREMKKKNRETYKNARAFSLFCKAKDAYDRGEEFESYKLLRSISEIGHDELEEITGYIRSDYFEHQEIVKEEQRKAEERRTAAEKAPKPVEEKPKEVKVKFAVTGHSSEKNYDPYNAKDYGYVEDFYDDHYDDFFDLDDAEDYYMDHYND